MLLKPKTHTVAISERFDRYSGRNLLRASAHPGVYYEYFIASSYFDGDGRNGSLDDNINQYTVT